MMGRGGQRGGGGMSRGRVSGTVGDHCKGHPIPLIEVAYFAVSTVHPGNYKEHTYCQINIIDHLGMWSKFAGYQKGYEPFFHLNFCLCFYCNHNRTNKQTNKLIVQLQ